MYVTGLVVVNPANDVGWCWWRWWCWGLLMVFVRAGTWRVLLVLVVLVVLGGMEVGCDSWRMLILI